MGLFRRKRAAKGEGAPPDATGITEAAVSGDGVDVGAGADETDGAQAPEPAKKAVLGSHTADELGPFDSADVPRPEGFLDLGSVWLPNLPGVTLMIETAPHSQDVTGLRVQIADSVLQLQVFAAPKSENLWDDIRSEIAAGLASSGGRSDERVGPYGDELTVTLPSANGPVVMRFLGVDGPRWFLRGVISGPAATNEELATPFIDLLRVVVVHRGDGPMAPRELLPMHMPRHIEARAPQSDADQVDYEAQLRPFERGPEITEVR